MTAPLPMGLRWLDRGLEALIAPSFTAMGYRLRARSQHWQAPEPGSLAGQVVVLTGATSGLGLQAAHEFVRLGAHLHFLARDVAKANAVQVKLRAEYPDAHVAFTVCDMADLDAVRNAATTLGKALPRIDVLIHNAGALDDHYSTSRQGIETTVAAHLIGPFALTMQVVALLKASPQPRVLWMSSGGMYAEALDVDHLEMPADRYDGVVAYARAKRAQVALAGLLAQKLAVPRLFVAALHPGWVDTPGVARSLPRFRRLLGPLLRTPEEGIDTLVWLAAHRNVADLPPGEFWLDRQPRAAHRLARTQRSDTPAQRERLWQWLVHKSGVIDKSEPSAR